MKNGDNIKKYSKRLSDDERRRIVDGYLCGQSFMQIAQAFGDKLVKLRTIQSVIRTFTNNGRVCHTKSPGMSYNIIILYLFLIPCIILCLSIFPLGRPRTYTEGMMNVLRQIQDDDASLRLSDIREKFFDTEESGGNEPSLSFICKTLLTGKNVQIHLNQYSSMDYEYNYTNIYIF
jgi:hypothetical protein